MINNSFCYILRRENYKTLQNYPYFCPMEIAQIREELASKVTQIDPIGKRLKFKIDEDVILIDGCHNANKILDVDNWISTSAYKEAIVFCRWLLAEKMPEQPTVELLDL